MASMTNVENLEKCKKYIKKYISKKIGMQDNKKRKSFQQFSILGNDGRITSQYSSMHNN